MVFLFLELILFILIKLFLNRKVDIDEIHHIKLKVLKRDIRDCSTCLCKNHICGCSEKSRNYDFYFEKYSDYEQECCKKINCKNNYNKNDLMKELNERKGHGLIFLMIVFTLVMLIFFIYICCKKFSNRRLTMKRNIRVSHNQVLYSRGIV